MTKGIERGQVLEFTRAEVARDVQGLYDEAVRVIVEMEAKIHRLESDLEGARAERETSVASLQAENARLTTELAGARAFAQAREEEAADQADLIDHLRGVGDAPMPKGDLS